jgi:hypothetical protein
VPYLALFRRQAVEDPLRVLVQQFLLDLCFQFRDWAAAIACSDVKDVT